VMGACPAFGAAAPQAAINSIAATRTPFLMLATTLGPLTGYERLS
jgi:hypothetical protein